MVSPNLVKKQLSRQDPAELNEGAKKIFQVMYSEKNRREDWDDDIPRIKVSALVSRLSFFYEKIRNAVDYDEEHRLRKNAIGRILKRQIVIEGVLKEADASKVSEHLLTELIRGRYLSNNLIPETKIGEIASILEKYILLKNLISLKINNELNIKADVGRIKDLINKKTGLTSWIIELVACEIEEGLGQNKVKQAVVGDMFAILSRIVKLPDDSPYGDDLEIQLYLSICRNYLKFDDEMLSFVLFKYYNSDWNSLSLSENAAAGTGILNKVSENIDQIRAAVSRQLEHPLKKQIDRVVRMYSLYFSILVETIDIDPAKVYNELEDGAKGFLSLLKKVCEKKYQKAKSRLWRSALRSIIYIFFTKSIFVILIEVPAIKFFNEPLNPVSLGINICFPAFLLFLIVFLTKTPGSENTEKIISGIKEIAFAGNEKKQPIVLRQPPKRNPFKRLIFALVYTASFMFSIWMIVKVLTLIHFNWVSMLIFLFFLAFVSFFSIMTTRGVKELIVVEKRESLVSFLLDLFYMPIIMAGRWMSGKFSKLNVFVFVFDFIIEAPFQVLIEMAEDWTRYVRERRENIE
jgi:hypothetical protein